MGGCSSESFKKLCENISHIEAKFYATDKFPAYDINYPSKQTSDRPISHFYR